MRYQPPFVPGATPAVPGIYNSNADASYVNGNPSTGQEGSYFPAEAIEHPQREIIQALVAAGITPSHTVLDQLAESMSRHASGGVFGIDSGGANALVVTRTGNYVVPRALFTGMRVHCRANAGNTGASTCNAFSLGARAVVNHLGSALEGGEWIAGQPIELVYDAALASGAGAYRLMPWANLRRRGSLPLNVQIFSSSGTWTKPAGLSHVFVKGVGAGGSGASRADSIYGGAGSAGAFFESWWPASDLSATETVTVGAGGASVPQNTVQHGNAGGDTTFKGVTAGGGAGGLTSTTGVSGGVFSSGGHGLAIGVDGLGSTSGTDMGVFHTMSAWGLFGLGGRGGKSNLASQAGGSGRLYVFSF